jgi:ABC-2 type transport system ATP-binding protein
MADPNLRNAGTSVADASAASRSADAPINVNAVENAIQVDHIVKKYGDFTAVDDVSFFVKEEEIFGLLGPNGAGKSTLIRMMTTLIPITSGVATIAGFDVSKDPDDARRAIGVIPQALTSDIDLTVEENLSIYAKLYDVPAQETQSGH